MRTGLGGSGTLAQEHARWEVESHRADDGRETRQMRGSAG